MVTVGAIAAAIDDAFPVERAEPWDAVGLLVGDPAAEVSGVFVTLDATSAALARARAAGANVLVTHHPAFLQPPARLTPRGAGVAFEAAAAGVALLAAHTNLDRDPEGASALAALIGLPDGVPLEGSLLPVSVVTVYVTPAEEARVRAAMAAAGAGRIGEYRGCSFAAEGTGRFTPAPEARPAVGRAGESSSAGEVRLEMVAAPGRVAAVVRAAVEAHPYEEPLITVTETAIARGDARMGRVSTLPEPATVAALASRAGAVFETAPRVWGAPDAAVERVVTATGSAGSLVPAALAADADALIAGEVRYHDALTALESGLAVIELGHDVSEWPLVPVLAAAVGRTPGLAAELLHVDAPSAAWWTP